MGGIWEFGYVRETVWTLTWTYSPEEIQRYPNSAPSYLRGAVNTTDLHGMFNPVDMVSVAMRTLIRPSWNKISITSFNTGRRPE